MKEGLKPCPFCGGQEYEVEDDFPQAFIYCESCGMGFNRCYDAERGDNYDQDGFKHMRDAWNKRA